MVVVFADYAAAKAFSISGRDARPGRFRTITLVLGHVITDEFSASPPGKQRNFYLTFTDQSRVESGSRMFRCAISTGGYNITHISVAVLILFLASRTVASSSRANAFHTSSVTLSKASQRISARNKKKNISRTAERLKEEALNQPSFVLGTRTAEEGEKWVNCKLSQVLVTEEQLVSTAETVTQRFSIGEVELPKEFGHGVTETEKTILFQDLPVATMNMTSHVSPDVGVVERAEVRTEETRELTKANLVAKALDLRNANAAGIAFENRRRIIEAFSTPANPFDPGRTEVQGGLHSSLFYSVAELRVLVSFQSHC